MSAFAWVFVSLLSTAEPVSATPLTLDAFGRDLGAELLPHDVLSDSLGSDRWAEFAAQSFYSNPKHQPGLAGLTLITSECSQSFRREHPQATAEDYDAFLATQEGMVFSERCAAKVEKDPEAAKRVIAGNLLMLEALLAVDVLANEGLTSVLPFADEVPPEARLGLESWIRESLDDHWQRIHCVVSKVAAQFEPAKIFVISDEFMEAVLPALADMESCKWPATRPLPAAVKAETLLPFDDFDRMMTLESEILLELEKQPGAEEWAELTMELVPKTDPDNWKRAVRGLELNGICSREYRRQNPKGSADDFDEFMSSAEGRAFLAKCFHLYLDDPGRSAARRDSLLALGEIGLLAARLLSALPRLAEEFDVDQEQDFPQLPERALGWARAQVPYVRCVIHEVMGAPDFDLAANVHAENRAQKSEALAAAVINSQVCLPADGSFDAFGRYIDMQTSLFQQMKSSLDSPLWARIVVQWASRDEPMWNRLMGEAKLRSEWSVAYRALKPQATAKDYDDFMATEAGRDLRISAVQRALKDPQRAEATRQTMRALLTLLSAAPAAVATTKALLQSEDFGESPEEQQSQMEKADEAAMAIFATIECVFTEATKTIPIEEIFYDSSKKSQAAIQAIFASGVCKP